MPKKITIELSQPILGHGGQVKRLTLREPTFGELAEFGDPVDFGYSKDAQVTYRLLNNVAIKRYFTACLETIAGDPSLDSILLEQLSLPDALRIRSLLLDFFSLPSDSADGKSVSAAAPKT